MIPKPLTLDIRHLTFFSCVTGCASLSAEAGGEGGRAHEGLLRKQTKSLTANLTQNFNSALMGENPAMDCPG